MRIDIGLLELILDFPVEPIHVNYSDINVADFEMLYDNFHHHPTILRSDYLDNYMKKLHKQVNSKLYTKSQFLKSLSRILIF